MQRTARDGWIVIALLFFATAISYVDRQVLTVLAPMLRDDLQISNTGYATIVTAFLLAYTFMQPVTGWLIDRLGTRIGFALIMGWWSTAAALHAFGAGIASFAAFRFLLGMGEAGSWSACVKAVSERFAPQQRGFVTGLWSSGVSFGLVVAVPLVAASNVAFGWRWTFILTGAVGFVWLAAWLIFYRDATRAEPTPRSSPIDARAIRRGLLRSRSVWALIAARFLADPWVWFYYFWIPEYLTRQAGFSAADVGKYGWIPFLTQGIGILLGGTLSDFLCRRGSTLIAARMSVMGLGMLLMAAGIVAAFDFDIVVIFIGISVAMLGFGLWAPNMMSLCADTVPSVAVGSLTGLTGMGAGIGGMLVTMATGWTLDRFGYRPVFIAAAVVPLLAFVVLFLLYDRNRTTAAA